ncbi:hypothetical protein, partial [Corynebacterium matruchotii]|uniref:hypothetical protein n=1 Tax=Corynebacterium matruchotii TaxID=43768 RepID=UPI00242AE812
SPTKPPTPTPFGPFGSAPARGRVRSCLVCSGRTSPGLASPRARSPCVLRYLGVWVGFEA